MISIQKLIKFDFLVKLIKMHKISDEYLEAHEVDLVKCPKCGSPDVTAIMDESGYFWTSQCNKCGYTKNNVPKG